MTSPGVQGGHCNELRALKRDLRDLALEFDAHRRASSLVIAELQQQIKDLERKQTTWRAAREYYYGGLVGA